MREGTGAICLCGMDTYLQRSTIGVWWAEGGLINYRGTMAGICVEEERGLPHVLREIDLPHVLREIDRHPCICAGEE